MKTSRATSSSLLLLFNNFDAMRKTGICITLSLVAIFFVTVNSCTDEKRELEKAIEYVNKQCPIKQLHWTIDSLKISEKGNIEYFCNSEQDAEYFWLLQNKKDSITNSIIDNLNSSKTQDSQKLVKLCKKYNAGIVYKYYSSNTNELCIINIPNEKLMADPAMME